MSEKLEKVKSMGLVDSDSTEVLVNFWVESPDELLRLLDEAGLCYDRLDTEQSE